MQPFDLPVHSFRSVPLLAVWPDARAAGGQAWADAHSGAPPQGHVSRGGLLKSELRAVALHNGLLCYAVSIPGCCKKYR
jgi:hypothetical protein